ncbi:RNA polymerase II accessory factor [Coprinopsis sp. MPI-PUGE-AT-0042]|nr:RNA polymerase II accessory factor [Coprinopsis sp. MPI-PUGE-AT-0042]
MSSPDPLSVLQQAIKSGSPITYSSSSSAADTSSTLVNATHLAFGGNSTFPKTTPTRYRKPGSSSNVVNEANVYSLEALYLAWLLKDAPEENGLAVGFVSVTERKKVVDWLEGSSAAAGGTPPGTPPQAPAALPTTTPGKSRTGGAGATSTSSPAKRRYVPDSADLEVVKRIKESEVELKDRTTALRGIKANNFSNVRTAFAEKIKKQKEASRSGSTASSSTTPDSKSRRRNNYPIIMISSSPTALITMYNVKRFLQESIFEESQHAKARAAEEGNPKAEDVIHIDRKKTIIETSGHAWDRVVFRPYKWSEPRVLFHHVKGVHVAWSNDPPNPKIKDWNVTELKIDPHRRHVDKSTVANFWKILDSWIQSNKPGTHLIKEPNDLEIGKDVL